jgi:hypothetical protein
VEIKKIHCGEEPDVLPDIIDKPLNLIDGGDEHEDDEKPAEAPTGPTGGMSGGFDLT